jgi:hypothetical protein
MYTVHYTCVAKTNYHNRYKHPFLRSNKIWGPPMCGYGTVSTWSILATMMSVQEMIKKFMRILQWQDVQYVPSFITGDEVLQKCTSLKAYKAPVLFLTPLTDNFACKNCEATKPPMDGILQAIFPGVRRLGCEADHSPICSAGLRMNGDYLHSPTQVTFMACTGTSLPFSGVPKGGGLGCSSPPPPEIPKFWQSRTRLEIERKMFSVPIPN